MNGRTIPMRVGDVDLLVETTPLAGTEPTSRVGDAAAQAAEGFDRAREAIVQVATSLVSTMDELQRRARRPDRIEVEFGLKFSTQGNVIVASASAEATLRVLVAYDGDSADPS